jgi:16S rRNA pseudouridine516 synthase
MELVITEGRFHQVRRMFGALGCVVLGLHRVRFGDLELGSLFVGEWMELSINTFDKT